MASPSAVWNEQRTVESFEIDMNGKLKPHILFAYLLNSAWNHAQGTAFGFQALSTRNLMWVLHKIQLTFVKMPFGETRYQLQLGGKE